MSDCDSEDEATNQQLKIVILGDSATGKVRKISKYLTTVYFWRVVFNVYLF